MADCRSAGNGPGVDRAVEPARTWARWARRAAQLSDASERVFRQRGGTRGFVRARAAAHRWLRHERLATSLAPEAFRRWADASSVTALVLVATRCDALRAAARTLTRWRARANVAALAERLERRRRALVLARALAATAAHVARVFERTALRERARSRAPRAALVRATVALRCASLRRERLRLAAALATIGAVARGRASCAAALHALGEAHAPCTSIAREASRLRASRRALRVWARAGAERAVSLVRADAARRKCAARAARGALGRWAVKRVHFARINHAGGRARALRAALVGLFAGCAAERARAVVDRLSRGRLARGLRWWWCAWRLGRRRELALALYVPLVEARARKALGARRAAAARAAERSPRVAADDWLLRAAATLATPAPPPLAVASTRAQPLALGDDWLLRPPGAAFATPSVENGQQRLSARHAPPRSLISPRPDLWTPAATAAALLSAAATSAHVRRLSLSPDDTHHVDEMTDETKGKASLGLRLHPLAYHGEAG
jgi:hypothetical protein